MYLKDMNICWIKLYLIHFFSYSGCGGVIHADTGIFKSPNYPQNFSANVECSWQIIAHEGNHLEMTFNRDFQIPDSSGSCQTSYIKVLAIYTEGPRFLGAVLNVLLGIDNSMKEKTSAAKNNRCIPVVFTLRGSGGLVVKETEVL